MTGILGLLAVATGNRSLHTPTRANIPISPYGSKGVNKGSGAHTMIASRGIVLAFRPPRVNGRLVSAGADTGTW